METVRVRVRDGKKSNPGSGINIPDSQHWLELRILLSSWSVTISENEVLGRVPKLSIY
jgi:hypothetical protein